MTGVSDKAVEAAATQYTEREESRPIPLARAMLLAAHDPALGLERSVCLRDVVRALRERTFAAERSTWGQAADFIEREFGGGSSA